MSLLPHHQTTQPVDTDGLLDAISQLEQNTQTNVQSRRGNNRVGLDSPVVVLPGNVSDRTGVQFEGQCRDISTHGCRLILKKPITVGDIYLIDIDDQDNSIDAAFGRCVRCHMLREDVFEVGINFFAPVKLSANTSTAGSLDLDLEIS